MNFSCDNCQRRYAIADEKVRGKSVRIKCKNCGHIITIQAAWEPPEEEQTRAISREALDQLKASASATANPWEEEATRAAPELDPSAQWFAMINGQQAGPFDPIGVTSKVGAGQITLETFLWRQGMAEWKRASEIPELAIVFAGGRAKPAAPKVPAAPPVAEAPRQASPVSQRQAQQLAQPIQSQPVQQQQQPVRAAAPRPTSSAPFDFENEPTQVPEQAPVRSQPVSPQPASQQPARAAAPAPASNNDALGELFSDVDLHQGGERTNPGAADEETLRVKKGDPFEGVPKVGKDRQAPASENTAAVVKKAGARRVRPFRVLAFLIVLISLPVAVLYGLTELELVPPIVVPQTDAQGNETMVNVFSREALEGFRDQLWGRPAEQTPAPAPVPAERTARAPAAAKAAEQPAATTAPGANAGAAVDPYAASEKQDLAPESEESTEPVVVGIPGDTLQKIVSEAQPAFKSCIERELKVNPRFKGGKINLVATVASSGVVRKAAVDPRRLDKTRVGVCLKGKVKRLVFPEFEGEDVEVEIPLILSGAM